MKTRTKIWPKSEFEIRNEEFEREFKMIALAYGLRRLECIKRHSDPEDLDCNHLFRMLARSLTEWAEKIAERYPERLKAYLDEHKEGQQ